jgi:hypothetical protein
MANVWKPQTIDVYKLWIEMITEQASDKLSVWEINFLESLSNWLDDGKNLTVRQAEILEKIYTEKTN